MGRPRTCRSRWNNFLLTGKNEFAKRASTKNNSTLTFIPTVFYNSTFTLAQTLAPDPLGIYINLDLRKAIILALELWIKGQKYAHLQTNYTLRKRSLKTQNFNLYYKNSHMKCYYFCQQCRTILIGLVPWTTNSFFLRLCFFKKGSIFAGSSTRLKWSTTILLFRLGTN